MLHRDGGRRRIETINKASKRRDLDETPKTRDPLTHFDAPWFTESREKQTSKKKAHTIKSTTRTMDAIDDTSKQHEHLKWVVHVRGRRKKKSTALCCA